MRGRDKENKKLSHFICCLTIFGNFTPFPIKYLFHGQLGKQVSRNSINLGGKYYLTCISNFCLIDTGRIEFWHVMEECLKVRSHWANS